MIAIILLFSLQISFIDCAFTTEEFLRGQHPLFGISELVADSKITKSACTNQLTNLYNALRKRETWALRLLDSSGAPRNGFIWGNNYWLGSYSQCRWISSKKAISPSKLTPSKSLEFPPYPVEFYVGTFKHNSSFQEQMNMQKEAFVIIGLCLPSSCSIRELGPLFESWTYQESLTVQALYNFSLKLQDIRMIKKDGLLINYPLLITISVTVVIISVLVIIGTLYDIYIWTPKRKQFEIMRSSEKDKNWQHGKIRNIRESDELLNRDNNMNDGNELKIDNSLHKSIPVPFSVLQRESYPIRRTNLREIFEKIFVNFSVASNSRALHEMNYDKDNVSAIHGLRFFAMTWIICLHTIYNSKDFADNKPLLRRVAHGLSEEMTTNSSLSVDTFFFTSGFILSYVYYRDRRGSSRRNDSFSIKRKVNEFSSMLLKRFIRLSPVYLVVLAAANVIFKLNKSTSLFNVTEFSQNVCEKYWWRNLLYINNLFKPDEMCMSWSWYLSTEMQFFMFGSILLIISSRFRKFAAAVTGGLIVVSALSSGYLSYTSDFTNSREKKLALLHMLHFPAWTRIGSYLIGIFTGYFVIHLKGVLIFNRATLITCWVVGSICNLWALFGLYNKDMSTISTALYNALSRPAWGFGLCWIITACTTDNAGILNRLLSFRGWIPLSKLSLTAYLLSPLIISLTYSVSETPIHLEFFPVVVYFFGFTGITYFCAYILCIMLELPFSQTGKWLIGGRETLNQLSQH